MQKSVGKVEPLKIEKVRNLSTTRFDTGAFFQCLIVSEGHLQHSIYDNRSKLTRGDAQLIMPGTEHFLIKDSCDYMLYAVSFKEELLTPNPLAYSRRMLKKLGENCDDKYVPSTIELNEAELIRLEHMLCALLIETAEWSYSSKGVATELGALLIEMLGRSFFKTQGILAINTDVDSARDAIRYCIDYIGNNYDKQLSLDTLAKQCMLSKSTMCKLFSEVTGTTPARYIARTRINEAKRLTCETDFAFNKISKCVGYEDFSTFYRAFMKLVGTTPDEYRKLCRLKAEELQIADSQE